MIETKGLVKIYKSKTGVNVKALDGIDLKLPSKGMVFILGKSGSGKSTLLNVLGGLDKYDDGEILIKGKSSKNFKAKDFDSYRNTYVGFIFQEYNILDDFTVGQNIALAMKLQGKKPKSEDINEILKEVDLEGLGERKPNELSGGQKQRVAIARALIKKPQIIMADEPTGALDSNTGIQIFDTLKKLSKEKLVLIVSHDREFSERYADRIIEIKDGKVLSDVSLSKEAKEVTHNVIYATNEILVKPNYTLTAVDLKEINAFLKKNKSDTRIKSIQNELRGRASFTKTDQSKVNMDNEGFKVIKSRLPFTHALKMGASGLKHKKFKLIMTIFLSLVSFTMLGLTSTFMLFAPSTTLANNWKGNNVYDFFNIGKSGVMKGSGFFASTNYDTTQRGLSSDDCKEIDKNLEGFDYTYLLGGLDSSEYSYSFGLYYYNNFGDTSSTDQICKGSFSYVGKSSDFKQYYGDYYLAGGRWPSAKGEIAIPLYAAQCFIRRGYKEEWSSQVEPIKDIREMIGKTLTLNPSNDYEENVYEITGIFEKGLDLTDSDYKEIIEKGYADYSNKKSNQFNNLRDYSASNVCVFSDDDYKEFENEGRIKFAFGVLPTDDINKLNKLANFSFKEYDCNIKSYDTNVKQMVYSSADLITNSIKTTVGMTSTMKNIFLIIGLVFVVFSGLLLANFIANSISYQRKEIGILRAIGSRGSDVFKIYMCESAIIALINFVLATIASWAVVKFAINPSLGEALTNIMQSGSINLLVFGIPSILIIFGVSLVASFLSTFLPVYLTAKKKPIDAIRHK